MDISIIGPGSMGKALSLYLSKKHNVKIVGRKDTKELVDPLLILAIKGKDLPIVAQQLTPFLKKEQIIISVLGGISLAELKKYFPKNPVLRAMPNMPITTGEGIVGLSADSSLGEKERNLIEEAFAGSCLVKWVEETLLPAFAALTSCAPAFVLMMIEAFIESGIYHGFSMKDSQEIAIQTFKGSASWLKESNQTPSALRWQVSSPGGSTIRGVHALEKSALRGVIMDAIHAAFSEMK